MIQRNGFSALVLSVAGGLTACVGTVTETSDTDDSLPALPTAVVAHKPIHRLSNTEYDNTVRDLLQTELRPGEHFIVETNHGFDNNADSLGMTPSQYESYFNSATVLVDDLFSDPARLARFMTCEPVTAADTGCAEAIVERFGFHAWRRPLSDEELATFVGLYASTRELGEDHQGAVRQVMRALLASAEFLYRIEQRGSANALEPVASYDIASRLSYFLWGTMPDERLLGLARDDELTAVDVLEQEVDRMLLAPQSRDFVASFAGQWLGLRALQSHAVLSDVYPEWDEELRVAMSEEAQRYFAEFLDNDLPFSEFLRADYNFYDARLAEHYGLPAPATPFARVSRSDDAHRGFLGLGAFLTVSSYAHRTSPTLRAKRVLETFLCTTPPDPPPGIDIPSLDGDDAANRAATLDNVRERLALHRTDPACATCHDMMDPIGFALEEFDAIGRHRTTYSNGDDIDASGVLPDGTSFDGLFELSDVLSNDPRFMSCAVEKLFTFALGRSPTKMDEPHLERIREEWTSNEPSLRRLIKSLVRSDPFRLQGSAAGGEP
jgi:hypothetical protein